VPTSAGSAATSPSPCRLAVASPLPPLMRIAGVGHDHATAAAAKRRILAFFDVHLRASAG
jgi:carboxymethylenebutenolidase